MPSTQQNSNLTMCSVFHSQETLNMLELNYQATQNLNPNQNFAWIAANNSLKKDSIETHIDDIHIIQGIRQDELKLRGNYHHSLGLNKLMPYVQTRFLLVIDSDFYIVRKNWIQEVLTHMPQNKLSCLGAPWHPKWPLKWRYIPAAQFCTFYDLDKVDINKLDFRPPFPKPTYKQEKPEHQKKSDILESILWITSPKRRFLIGKSKEIGYRILHDLLKKPEHKSEALTPVFRPKEDFIEPYMGSAFNRILETFIPDKFSFIPKHKNYYTKKSFADHGRYDARSYAFEEFMWKKNPFGFHIRGTKQYHVEKEEKKEVINKALKSFAINLY